MTYKSKFRLILLLIFFVYSNDLKSQANFEGLVGTVNSEAITTSELNTYKIVNAGSIVLSESSVADLQTILNKA